jgi:hypothetical protein
LEGGEAFSCPASERDDTLALVTLERLFPGGDCRLAAAGGCHYLAEVEEGVALA